MPASIRTTSWSCCSSNMSATSMPATPTRRSQIQGGREPHVGTSVPTLLLSNQRGKTSIQVLCCRDQGFGNQQDQHRISYSTCAVCLRTNRHRCHPLRYGRGDRRSGGQADQAQAGHDAGTAYRKDSTDMSRPGGAGPQPGGVTRKPHDPEPKGWYSRGYERYRLIA